LFVFFVVGMSVVKHNTQNQKQKHKTSEWFHFEESDLSVSENDIHHSERVVIDLDQPLVTQDQQTSKEETVSVAEACVEIDLASRKYDPTGVAGVRRLQKGALTVPIPFAVR
jgi:hypothetical protein